MKVDEDSYSFFGLSIDVEEGEEGGSSRGTGRRGVRR